MVEHSPAHLVYICISLEWMVHLGEWRNEESWKTKWRLLRTHPPTTCQPTAICMFCKTIYNVVLLCWPLEFYFGATETQKFMDLILTWKKCNESKMVYSPAVLFAVPSCEPICVRCAASKINAKKWIGTDTGKTHGNDSITSRLRFVRLKWLALPFSDT